MKRLIVDPYEVWCFYHYVNVSLGLARAIRKDGWKNTPPVPLFEIPEKYRISHHKYLLVSDGSHRWAAAFAINESLPAILYARNEKIDSARDGLRPLPSPEEPTQQRYIKMLFSYLHPEYVRKKMDAAYKD
jgi:hypothetical protein